MKYLLYKEGGVLRVAGISDEALISITPEEIAANSVPDGTPYAIYDGLLPADCIDFFDAWDFDFEAPFLITVNIIKARDIKRDQIRAERAPLLADLDVRALRAIGANNAQELAQVEIEKQKLRDAPAHPSISLAETTGELKAITLSGIISA